VPGEHKCFDELVSMEEEIFQIESCVLFAAM